MEVSVLSLSGAIPSGGVGRAQIKAIPGRLHPARAEISTAGWQWHELPQTEHWPHATYQCLPEVHITGSFVLTQYVEHLRLGDCSVH